LKKVDVQPFAPLPARRDQDLRALGFTGQIHDGDDGEIDNDDHAADKSCDSWILHSVTWLILQVYMLDRKKKQRRRPGRAYRDEIERIITFEGDPV
jgi:hypothetical protein